MMPPSGSGGRRSASPSRPRGRSALGRPWLAAAFLLAAALFVPAGVSAEDPIPQEEATDGDATLQEGEAAGPSSESAAPGPSVADPADAELPSLDFVVEAEAPPSDDAGPSAFSTELDAEELSKAVALSLAEILEWAPGVQVTRYGSSAQGAYASIRGSSSEQVLVLLNGKRLNSAQGGGVDLSRIDPETVERVEVIRGGASARYGENALGGVINIVTKGASKPQNGGAAFIHYGSWNTVKAGASLEGATSDGGADGYLSASGLYSGGAFGYGDEDGGTITRTNADVAAGDLYGSFSLYPAELLELTGTLTAHADEKGVPGIVDFPTESARMEDQQLIGSFGALWARDGSSAEASLSVDAHRRRYQDPEYPFGAQDDTHENLALQTSSTLKTAFRLPWSSAEASGAAGLQYRFDALRSTALVSDSGAADGGTVLRHGLALSARTELPLPAMDALGLPAAALYPSARFDAFFLDYDSPVASSAPTWQLGLALPWSRLTFKGNVGTSFRSPSFDDLFWPSTAFAVGNPELKPERALSLDAGLEAAPWKPLRLELSYFDRRIEDLIVWTPGANGQWTPSNLDSATVRGVEFGASGRFSLASPQSELFVRVAGTWTDGRNTTEGSVNEGNLLPNIATLLVSCAAEWSGEGRAEGLFLRAEWIYTGPRYITAANTKALDGAAVVNLGAGVPLGKKLSFKARLENLTDVVYVDLRDYPVPGREFSVRLDYDF